MAPPPTALSHRGVIDLHVLIPTALLPPLLRDGREQEVGVELALNVVVSSRDVRLKSGVTGGGGGGGGGWRDCG